MPTSFLRSLLMATAAVLIAVGLNATTDDMARVLGLAPARQELAGQFSLSLIWLAGAHWFNVLSGYLFWETLVKRALRRSPPRLIVQLVNVVVLLIAISGIVGIVFDRSITALWATSGAVGLVVGFALRNLILDTFSGLAIHMEEPFKVGDWIICHTRFGKFTGRVEETNWRSTRLWGPDNNVVIVPNSILTSTIVTNCSLPDNVREFELPIVLDFRIPVERVQRLLLAAVRQTIKEDGLLDDPPPKIRVSNTLPEGVEYTITYCINPVRVPIGAARDQLLRNILRHLNSAGVTLSHPRRDVFVARMPWRQRDWRHNKDLSRQLARLPMFNSLSEAELAQLSSVAAVHELRQGETVVTQGEAGESMFVLAEGLLAVFLLQPDGSELRVGDIVPGQFFGERSLLTGEPRSATISCVADCMVVEINKEAIAGLLKDNEALVTAFSRAVIERELHNGAAVQLSEQRQLEARIAAETGPLMRRLKTFFGLQS